MKDQQTVFFPSFIFFVHFYIQSDLNHLFICFRFLFLGMTFSAAWKEQFSPGHAFFLFSFWSFCSHIFCDSLKKLTCRIMVDDIIMQQQRFHSLPSSIYFHVDFPASLIFQHWLYCRLHLLFMVEKKKGL